ncbi:MAG: aminoglycoside phosphotransferase family protein [Chloroflexota bacterium]|nr:aminoglycoside phosphotransferase family protein [Chloroflexota bacterium]
MQNLTREYSKLLGVLSAEQLQAALDRFGLGRLLDARPAPGGLFGQNVLLSTSAGGYVLRGCPYDGQLEKEQYFSRIIHERTRAIAPWPFQIEESPEIFGWSYAMMPLLAGVHLSDPDVRRTLSKDDRLALARAMGTHLGLMQEATWDTPGEYDFAAHAIVPIGQPFAGWFIRKTREWLDRCRAASSATPADVAWIDTVIDAARDALAMPFVPVLVHTDYKEGNVVAEREGAGWRITGIFDMAEAYAGDGEYDLARAACDYGLQSESMLNAFIDAYMAGRPARPGVAERLALYILHDRLIIWEYGQRHGILFEPGVTFRQFAQRFVDLASV